MKVLLFHNMVAPYRHELFKEIARRVDLKVWYSTLKTRDRNWSVEIPDGYDYKLLKSSTYYLFNRPFILCRSIGRQLKVEQPDLILSVLTRSNVVDILKIVRYANKNKIPIVLWVGDVESDQLKSEVPWLVNRIFETLYKRILKQACGYIFYSDLSRKWTNKQVSLNKKPLVTGSQVLSILEEPRLIIPGSDKIHLLYVGKLEYRKGFDLMYKQFLDLYTKSPTIHLTIVGSGPLESLIDKQHTGITHKPHIQRDDLWAIYRNSDLLIVPSRHDPWGFVTNEAMAMGTPVMASTYAGCCEMAAKAGWTFNPLNASEFSGIFEKAIQGCRDKNLRKKAFDTSREYNIKGFVDKLIPMLEVQLQAQNQKRTESE